MKRSLGGAALAGLVFAACGGGAEEAAPAADEPIAHNTLSAAEEAAGWQLLFDGVSTDGWRGYGRDDFPSGGWAVEGGELVGLSSSGDMDGGDLITTAEFADFELVFDFNLGPASNSGVFFRVQEHDGAGLWQVAPEYQVLDDTAYYAPGAADGITRRTGENYDLHAAGDRPVRPLGEWNTGRLVVEGTHVEHWLNGVKTLEYELHSPDWDALVEKSKFGVEQHYARAASGAIGLQDHGTPIRFRNIKIRPIAAGG